MGQEDGERWTDAVALQLPILLPRSFPVLAIGRGSVLARDLVMAISEDCSGGTDHARRMTKYQGLANAIGRHSTRR
jgi:hypothetical protein